MKKILTIIFVVLYVAVGFISCIHACTFFGIANDPWMAVILAVAFELGQAVILFALLTDKSQAKKPMPWVLMSVLTAVQVIGNIFASYQYMIQHSQDQIRYFTDSVLFFVADPNPQVNTVMISYIVGAILPIVALCMTGMVVSQNEKPTIGSIPEPTPSKPDINIDLM